MRIHKNFTGGNIQVVEQNGDTICVMNEIRDTQGSWFYWAFCVECAQGKTLTFRFEKDRLGYFGPAVSHDLKEWHWLDCCGEDEFTYTFGMDENKVYFAHSMLYHPERFIAFAKSKGLEVQEFCRSRKNRSVPCVTIGKGNRSIVLTARHHACESTGNYVLEGVLEELLLLQLPDTKILCVPFIDYDGVVDGDQGKGRKPYDHNRDYNAEKSSIYPETAKIREYVEKNGCRYGFDFHSPWHLGGSNDRAFIVHKSFEKKPQLDAFGERLQQEMTAEAFQYRKESDYPYLVGWNQPSTCFGSYMLGRAENEVAFTLETAYFGTSENKISQQNMVELGRCFARAFKRYIDEVEK